MTYFHVVSGVGTVGLCEGPSRLTVKPKCLPVLFCLYSELLPEFLIHCRSLDLLKLCKFKIEF